MVALLLSYVGVVKWQFGMQKHGDEFDLDWRG